MEAQFSSQSRRTTLGGRSRTLTVWALAVSLLVMVLGGAASAIGAHKAKSFQDAATYYVSVAPDGGPGVSVDVLKIGQAVIFANCSAGMDPNPAYGMGIFVGMGVRNNGSDPIMVTLDSNDGIAHNVWLPPGAEDRYFHVGQGANETGDYGDVQRFAILDFGGKSATGLAAWSARRNLANNTGECVFSAQAKG